MVRSHGTTVEFSFFRPQASQVNLVGDFNGWDQRNCPMMKRPGGWWRCEVALRPGCYQFKYLCDGEWFLDHAAFGLEYSPFGMNSVVFVDRDEDTSGPAERASA